MYDLQHMPHTISVYVGIFANCSVAIYFHMHASSLSDIDGLARFWLSWLCTLICSLPKAFEVSGFPIFWLWAFLMKVITAGTLFVQYDKYLYFYFKSMSLRYSCKYRSRSKKTVLFSWRLFVINTNFGSK